MTHDSVMTGTKWKSSDVKLLHSEHMALNFGHFGRSNRNTWNVLKCDAEEGGKRSVGPIM